MPPVQRTSAVWQARSVAVDDFGEREIGLNAGGARGEHRRVAASDETDRSTSPTRKVLSASRYFGIVVRETDMPR